MPVVTPLPGALAPQGSSRPAPRHLEKSEPQRTDSTAALDRQLTTMATIMLRHSSDTRKPEPPRETAYLDEHRDDPTWWMFWADILRLLADGPGADATADDGLLPLERVAAFLTDRWDLARSSRPIRRAVRRIAAELETDRDVVKFDALCAGLPFVLNAAERHRRVWIGRARLHRVGEKLVFADAQGRAWDIAKAQAVEGFEPSAAEGMLRLGELVLPVQLLWRWLKSRAIREAESWIRGLYEHVTGQVLELERWAGDPLDDCETTRWESLQHLPAEDLVGEEEERTELAQRFAKWAAPEPDAYRETLALLRLALEQGYKMAEAKKLVASQRGIGVSAIDAMFTRLRSRTDPRCA